MEAQRLHQRGQGETGEVRGRLWSARTTNILLYFFCMCCGAWHGVAQSVKHSASSVWTDDLCVVGFGVWFYDKCEISQIWWMAGW